MRSPRFWRLSAVLATVSVAAIAPSSLAADYPSDKVSVTFTTVTVDKPMKDLFYKSGSRMSALIVNSTISAKTYSYNGNATMDLLRPTAAAGGDASVAATGTAAASGSAHSATTSPAGTGKNDPVSIPMTAVGHVTFPKDGDYVVYMSTADDGSIKAAALSSKTDFPLGSVKVINFTSFKMAVKINGVNVPLAAGKSLILPFNGLDKFPLIIQRMDVDPPTGVVGAMMAKPSPGMRATEFIVVGNSVDVAKQDAEPNFNLLPVNDSGSVAPTKPVKR